MDFLITAFLLWVWNLFFPDKNNGPNQNSQQRDYENGAAFFFSSSHLHENTNEEAPPVNEDYDGGPEW